MVDRDLCYHHNVAMYCQDVQRQVCFQLPTIILKTKRDRALALVVDGAHNIPVLVASCTSACFSWTHFALIICETVPPSSPTSFLISNGTRARNLICCAWRRLRHQDLEQRQVDDDSRWICQENHHIHSTKGMSRNDLPMKVPMMPVSTRDVDPCRAACWRPGTTATRMTATTKLTLKKFPRLFHRLLRYDLRR